jgi:hypothetical protein
MKEIRYIHVWQGWERADCEVAVRTVLSYFPIEPILRIIQVPILYFRAVLRIRDVHPGSRIRIFSIPDPGSKRFPDPASASASKSLSILT